MGKFKYKVVRLSGKSIMIDPRSPFSLEYKNGETVEAPEGTLGIMVFDRLSQALEWISGWNLNFAIKRVIPVSRGNRPDLISRVITTKDLKVFYEDLKESGIPSWGHSPIDGTICYPSVYVHSDVVI